MDFPGTDSHQHSAATPKKPDMVRCTSRWTSTSRSFVACWRHDLEVLCATCGQWSLSRLASPHLAIAPKKKRWFLSVINTLIPLIHPIPSRSTFCSGFGVAALECHPLIDSSAAHPKLGSKLKATRLPTRWAEFLFERS